MLHFGRRGRENLSSLTRKDFAVQRGSDNLLYVYKTSDERTKNHQDDSDRASDGRMYEIQGTLQNITLICMLIYTPSPSKKKVCKVYKNLSVQNNLHLC